MKYYALFAAVFASASLADTVQLSAASGPITSAYISGRWIKQQEFKISWSAPKARQDGKPLAYAELAKYSVYSANIQSATTLPPTVRTVEKKLTAIKIKQPLCSTYWYRLTATDTKQLESAPSSTLNVATYCPP